MTPDVDWRDQRNDNRPSLARDGWPLETGTERYPVSLPVSENEQKWAFSFPLAARHGK